MSPTRNKNTASVAAVYDRRKSTALTEMLLQDKTVRCSSGLRPPEENESGAHRDAATEQPLQKSRLRRLDRVFVGSPIFFLTACTLDRRPILDCELLHNAFLTFCLNSPQHGASVGRYVLMSDHLHLFVSLDEISLSNWVKSLKNTLSKTLRSVGHEGPHWQKGFFDHLLRSGEYLTPKSGNMCVRILCEPDWSKSLRIGPTQARFMIWSIANEDESCSGGL
jgi:putative transposase